MRYEMIVGKWVVFIKCSEDFLEDGSWLTDDLLLVWPVVLMSGGKVQDSWTINRG